MMEETIIKWHQHLRGSYEPGLEDLLHDDCVFLSPIVFSPQRGKTLTMLYLNAAGATLGDPPAESSDQPAKDENSKDVKFHYIKEVVSGNHAVLEFEQTLDGKYINGVDILTCDDEGKIIEFKVMIRPLQAVNLMHQKMAAMLKKMEAKQAG
jgi:hypothetical protein